MIILLIIIIGLLCISLFYNIVGCNAAVNASIKSDKINERLSNAVVSSREQADIERERLKLLYKKLRIKPEDLGPIVTISFGPHRVRANKPRGKK